MKWRKLGLILNIANNTSWMRSHASLPIAKHLSNDVFRIYFSTRNKENKSHAAFIDVNILNPKEILRISEEPLLTPGNYGLFDDSGVSLSCIVENYFYYLGWNLLKTVPFSNQVGLAISYEKSELTKNSVMPIVGKCEKEPFSFGYPWVIKHNGIYKMWYDAIMDWKGKTTNDYRCSLRCAESIDGITWEKKYVDCIPLKNGELCIARPCVIAEDSIFKMWYSINYKGEYKLGYAESNDGVKWIRKDDEVGLEKSTSGWDSEQIEYPFVFDHKGERYMLYNGNGYGKTGFGLAKLIK